MITFSEMRESDVYDSQMSLKEKNLQFSLILPACYCECVCGANHPGLGG